MATGDWEIFNIHLWEYLKEEMEEAGVTWRFDLGEDPSKGSIYIMFNGLERRATQVCEVDEIMRGFRRDGFLAGGNLCQP